MKKLIITLMIAAVGGTFAASGQISGQVKEEMKRVRKEYKTDKLAKNETKKREKAGWTVLEGSLPMETQFEESYTRQNIRDDEGEQIYYFGHGSFSTDDKNAAYKNACLAARQDIASQLETELVEAFATDIRSEKLSSDESITVSKAFAEGKAVVNNKLAGTKPLVKIYRRNKYQYEVVVEMYYSREKARELVRDAIREKLANEDSGLRDIINDILETKIKK